MIRRLLFWIFLSPLLALMTTSAIVMVGEPTSWARAFEAALGTLFSYTAFSLGALCMWCAYSFDKEPQKAKSGMLIVGSLILFIWFSATKFWR